MYDMVTKNICFCLNQKMYLVTNEHCYYWLIYYTDDVNLVLPKLTSIYELNTNPIKINVKKSAWIYKFNEYKINNRKLKWRNKKN